MRVIVLAALATFWVIVALVGIQVASRSGSAYSPAPALTGVPPVLGPEHGPRADGMASAPVGTPPPPAVANVAISEGSPEPTTPMPALHLVSRDGLISHMGPGYPASYLALPCKHGNVRCDLLVRLCGPADCVTMRQTDYGPSQRLHPDRSGGAGAVERAAFRYPP